MHLKDYNIYRTPKKGNLAIMFNIIYAHAYFLVKTIFSKSEKD